MASSLAASRRFVNPRVHEHDKGHALPTRQIDIRAVAEFLAQFARPEPTADADADTLASWAEELATLEAIYGDDFAVDDDHPDAAALAELTAPAAVSVAFSVRLDGAGADPDELPPGELRLSLTFPRGYPHGGATPRFALGHQLLADELPPAGARAIERAARDAAKEALAGGETSVVFAAVTAANAVLAEGGWRGGGDAPPEPTEAEGEGEGEEEEEEEEEEAAEGLPEAQRRRVIREMAAEARRVAARTPPAQLMGGGERSADGAASLRGQWSYRVGLVGKPSVGKSSLFNALTHATVADGGARAAKVGAAPFTTIDPNLGAGWWAAPAASEPASLVEARSACEHGRAADAAACCRWRCST